MFFQSYFTFLTTFFNLWFFWEFFSAIFLLIFFIKFFKSGFFLVIFPFSIFLFKIVNFSDSLEILIFFDLLEVKAYSSVYSQPFVFFLFQFP